MEGAYDFLGNSANRDSICQAKGEPGQAPVPTPTLEKKQSHIMVRHTGIPGNFIVPLGIPR